MTTHPVLLKRGDASAEVEAALKRLGGPGPAGLHRYFHVVQARQTVVMLTHADAPIADALLARGGWTRPTDPTPPA